MTDVSGSVCEVEVEADIRDYGVGKIKQFFLKLKIVRKKDGSTITQEFSYPINETNNKIKL